jgi:hypothetical protein
MYTGLTRLFSPFGVVASAFETASTLDGSVVASFGGSLELFGVGSFADCLDEYAGALRWGVMCLVRRPRGPGGGGVPRVANVRVVCRGRRNDHLAAGNIVIDYLIDKSYGLTMRELLQGQLHFGMLRAIVPVWRGLH